MWTFFARPLRRSALELMRVNRQVYQESTYMLYRFSTFWFSEMQSLTSFVNGISAANLALVRTVRLRLGAEELYDAFQANFSAAYVSSSIRDLDHVVSLWNLDHLIIEFPYGFQLHPPWTPPFGVCTVVWCKWIIKAVMDYCSARPVATVAKRVDFLGGPGFLPGEQWALAQVKLMHNSMSFASMDVMSTGTLEYVPPLLHFNSSPFLPSPSPFPERLVFSCAAISFPLTPALFSIKLSLDSTLRLCNSMSNPHIYGNAQQ